jgi:uncharacterized NAD(P)/FAD-binding protein YdhS
MDLLQCVPLIGLWPRRAQRARAWFEDVMQSLVKSTPTSSSQQIRWIDTAPAQVDVAIVGGGFSGLVALVHLCRARPSGTFAVIECHPLQFPGTAYGGCDSGHLLNVPAGRMGPITEDPTSFHRWLETQTPGKFRADAFVPRALFGAYLTEFVADEVARSGAHVSFVRAAVIDMHDAQSHVNLTLDCACGAADVPARPQPMVARCVVIAPGLPASPAPWAAHAQDVPAAALIPDPWKAGALLGIPPNAEIMLLGSGLTAVDITEGLRRLGHRGIIRMVSRNGRLPLPHADHGEPPMLATREQFAGSPAKVLSVLRSAARQRMAAGLGWQGAIDAIRPHIPAIWKSWSTAERRHFLRRARALWEIHRHRVPCSVLADITAQCAAGTLLIERGELVAMHPATSGTVAASVRSADGATHVHTVVRVINCTGPSMNLRDTHHSLLASVQRTGLACTDDLGLGLRSDDESRMISANGVANPRIVIAGALRRGDLWEATAVPDLRVHAARAAATLLALLADQHGKVNT